MGTVVVELRIDAVAAATLHRWVEETQPGVALATAVRIGAEATADALADRYGVESYAEATAYLASKSKRGGLNRHARGGITVSLRERLLHEGRTDAVASHVVKDVQPTEMTREAMIEAGQRYMEMERLKRVIEGKAPMQMEVTPDAETND